ncbi:MAG: S-methyl-5'-thioadenosine phosphorylase, partial [Thermoplasmata archaeon]
VTLARERAICYACLAMVTDFDVWAERPVEVSEIIATMNRNVEQMQRILGQLLPTLAAEPTCSCAHALDSAAV